MKNPPTENQLRAWLLVAVILLDKATSNSTDPAEREAWRRGRSRLFGELAEQ